ncbi:class II fructose-bisphosphate aldolase [Streptomyces ziwulingensis]|uniref:Class II fructose-1,6-bisphosphate aldolase n=1 Tax=Streptomyces ziwulingensis TaxID=1045501 RepID=A0ABP9CJ32_9ACTN
MSVVRLRELLDDARTGGYAIPAFNVIDELSMDAVVSSAARARSPVVVQVSVRTARFWGPGLLHTAFEAKRRLHGATAVLHLDHCQDPGFLLSCLDSGWRSALFDSSHLPAAQSVRETRRLVAQAERREAEIEGEFERIVRVDAPPEPAGPRTDPADVAAFLDATGVHCFGPDLGTRHGTHLTEPKIDYERARWLSSRVPVVLHGGSGLPEGSLRKAVDSGVTKVNFSSVLKETYTAAVHGFARAGSTEPLDLVRAAHSRIGELCRHYADVLGSTGRSL